MAATERSRDLRSMCATGSADQNIKKLLKRKSSTLTTLTRPYQNRRDNMIENISRSSSRAVRASTTPTTFEVIAKAARPRIEFRPCLLHPSEAAVKGSCICTPFASFHIFTVSLRSFGGLSVHFVSLSEGLMNQRDGKASHGDSHTA